MCALNGRRVLGGEPVTAGFHPCGSAHHGDDEEGGGGQEDKDNINIKCKLPGFTIFSARHATMYLNMSKAVHVCILTIVNKVPR